MLCFLIALSLMVPSWPPQIPHDGATKVFDNDQVTIWDVSGDKGEPTPLHEHRLAALSVTIQPTHALGYEGGLMREPYNEPYGKGGTFRGLQVTPLKSYTEIVQEIHRLGWRPGTHSVGDDAVEQVISAYEAAHEDQSIVGRRFVLEHGFLPSADHFERMSALGIALTAQHHPYAAGPAMVRYWGSERASRVPPMRSYLDGGVVAASGSDSGVVPYPPPLTFYYFVTRTTMHGRILGPEHKETRQEALRMATWNNAYLTFEEGEKGSIEPGKLADFVVLSDDIMTVPDEQIEHVNVVLTVVGGDVVYRDASFPESEGE